MLRRPGQQQLRPLIRGIQRQNPPPALQRLLPPALLPVQRGQRVQKGNAAGLTLQPRRQVPPRCRRGRQRPCRGEEVVLPRRLRGHGRAPVQHAQGRPGLAHAGQRHAQHAHRPDIARLQPQRPGQLPDGVMAPVVRQGQQRQGDVQRRWLLRQADGPADPAQSQCLLPPSEGRQPPPYQQTLPQHAAALRLLQGVQQGVGFLRRLAVGILLQVVVQAVAGGFPAAQGVLAFAQLQPGFRQHVLPGAQPVQKRRSLLIAAHLLQLLGQPQPARRRILLHRRTAQKHQRILHPAPPAVIVRAAPQPVGRQRKGDHLAKGLFAHITLAMSGGTRGSARR